MRLLHPVLALSDSSDGTANGFSDENVEHDGRGERKAVPTNFQ